MSSLCLVFQAHQPHRLKPYMFHHIGKDHHYGDAVLDRESLRRVAERCYLPANYLLERRILRFAGKFRFALALSGTLIEQLEAYEPVTLRSFQTLIATGHVELLAEPYYHSLAILHSPEEFARQLDLHAQVMQRVFGQKPKVIHNTALFYANRLADQAAQLGYTGMICEAEDRILNGRSPNYVYRSPKNDRCHLLLRSRRLSGEMAERFGDPNWMYYPITAQKFARWVYQQHGDIVNLCWNYEMFGDGYNRKTGIFDFLEKLPNHILDKPNLHFHTPSQVLDRYTGRDLYNVPLQGFEYPPVIHTAPDEEPIILETPWAENELQRDAQKRLYDLEARIHRTCDPELMARWSQLQTIDHFYYMSTKAFEAGTSDPFSPYDSPFDAYIHFCNVLEDIALSLPEEITV